MSSLRTAIGICASVALAVAFGGSARAAYQPIEGTWDYGTGQVVVTASGTNTYVGEVTKEAVLSAGCPHPVGEAMWQITGSGTHYEGTHDGFGPNGCSDRRTFPATFDVTESAGHFILTQCSTITTDNNRVDCADFKRLKPPSATAPTVTTPKSSKPATTRPSAVGVWKLNVNRQIYRWASTKRGFVERATSSYRLSHGCRVPKGAFIDRYVLTKSGLYRITYQYWRPPKCTTYLKTQGLVRIVVSAKRMTVSCENAPTKVCRIYTRK